MTTRDDDGDRVPDLGLYGHVVAERTARASVRPPAQHPRELEDYDSFSLAAELVRRGAVVKGRVSLPVLEPEGPRPRVRADCVDGPRPCPWVRCRHHLWRMDGADRRGRRDELRGDPPTYVGVIASASCALDIVDKEPDGALSSIVGASMAVTSTRVTQLEAYAMRLFNKRMRKAMGECDEDGNAPQLRRRKTRR